jgi:predicted amidohydrolase YtcJ
VLRSDLGAPDEPADLVLRGGTVLALDAADTRGTALAVRDGMIVAVGSDATADALTGPQTPVVDLAGRAVLPGINDSHVHATWLGATWPTTVMDAMAAGTGPGSEADAHTGADLPPLVSTEAERRGAILHAGELLASLGITSYTEPGLGPGEDDGETGCFSRAVFDSYVALEREGALRARVTVLALFGVLDGHSDLSTFERGLRGIPELAAAPRDPRRLRLAGVKIFADGIPPMLQAWTRHDYPDGSHGSLLVGGESIDAAAADLRAMIQAADALGLQVGVHATGDRAIATVVDAVAEARRRRGTTVGRADRNTDRNTVRHYVIHGDLVEARTLRAMAELGMGLNVQAGIATRTVDWVRGVLGDDVAEAAWPLRAALQAGVDLSLSSDGPILSPDWRAGIAAADEWMGPAREGGRERRMLDLLRAYTATPARQDGAEGWKGTLEPGKVADLCVLETDPLGVEPCELPSVGVELTVLGGDIVYSAAPALTG